MHPQAKITQMSSENPAGPWAPWILLVAVATFLDSKALFSKWLYNYVKSWLFWVQIG